SESVSVRARLRGLDWTGAEAAFEWRQGQARSASASQVTVICVVYSRQGRLLSFASPRSIAPSIGLGSRRYLRGRPPRGPPLRLPTNRADGLGHDAPGRTLQRTRRAGGVNEIAPANRRDGKVGKGKQHVMQNRSIWRSGQPTFPHAWSNAGY